MSDWKIEEIWGYHAVRNEGVAFPAKNDVLLMK
jgi:hypothetical protein